MSEFRLALINPNTSEQHTREMARAARAVLPASAEVLALTAPHGSGSIETDVEHVFAAAAVVELVRATPEASAYLIACFGDPAVNAARELTDAPVVGIGEAAYRAALLVARRFAVITTLARGIPELESGMERLGVRSGCVGVLALGIPVSQQGEAFAGTTEAIVSTGRQAVDELRAEALVLACGGMAHTEAVVRERVGVPATNGVAFGALLAHALWRAGLRTSKVGSLALAEQLDAQPLGAEARGC